MAWPEGIPNWLKNAWGLIEGQVRERVTTQQIMASLRPYAEQAPGGWGPRGVIYVSQLRGIAGRIRTASEAVTRSGFQGRITAEHIAEAPWARSPAQRQLSPRYAIRSLVTFTNPDFLAGVAGVPEELQRWVTHYTTTLPYNLQVLTAQQLVQAEQEGSPPGPVTGVSALEILEE